jgi:hypothetical protein
VKQVLENPELFADLFRGVLENDPVVRMRSADAMEKVSVKHPEWLKPYKSEILSKMTKIDRSEVQWHVAQMIPRLDLDETECDEAVNTLVGYLQSRSSIVRTFSLQALADLAGRVPTIKPMVRWLLQESIEKGTSAMRNRSRTLLARLQQD